MVDTKTVYKVGENVQGKGIYLGQMNFPDIAVKNGKFTDGPKKIFNLFAAPTNMTDDSNNVCKYSFNRAIQRCSNLHNWHGHDGYDYSRHPEAAWAVHFNHAVNSGAWFFPNKSLLESLFISSTIQESMDSTFPTGNYWTCEYIEGIWAQLPPLEKAKYIPTMPVKAMNSDSRNIVELRRDTEPAYARLIRAELA